jgi:hypothetical protein
VSDWGPTMFGDPCRQCGFDWSTSQPDTLAVVEATPGQFARLLDGRDGSQRHPELAWSAVAYVCHVADNLRIWAERLAGLGLGASGPVPPFDQDDRADVRHYADVPVQAALWSLRRATLDWLEAVALVAGKSVALRHPERGVLRVLDVCRMVAHDAAHHGWDIERTVS